MGSVDVNGGGGRAMKNGGRGERRGGENGRAGENGGRRTLVSLRLSLLLSSSPGVYPSPSLSFRRPVPARQGSVGVSCVVC